MGIDVGHVRVGVAFSDPLGITVSPHAVLEKAQGRAEKAILKLITENDVKKLIVGMPYDKDGNKTPQCELVEHFVARLKRRINLPIEYRDEYLSSEDALERMKSSGKYSRGTAIDAYAAMVILEDYIRDNAPIDK